MADAQSKNLTQQLHIGTMGWSYNFWKGNFYPETLPSTEFLAYYAAQFGTVEVDSTFYRIPRAQTIKEWDEQTPQGFLFSLKFPQIITHVKMLRNCEEETKVFLERVDLLGKKLGTLLLQFPQMFGQQHVPSLRDYLGSLPTKHRYAVEVRNKTLLSDNVYALLKDSGTALVWVDSAQVPQASELTADFIYVRWEGDRKLVNGTLGKAEAGRAEQIQAWAHKLKPFADRGIAVFGYFSKYYSGFPPSDVRQFLEV